MTTFSGTMAIRAMKNNDFQAVIYPGTEAGLVAALAYVAAPSVTAPGGEVRLGPGTLLITAPLSLGNSVLLRGSGRYTTAIKAAPTFAGAAMITNTDQAGGQQWCAVENLTVNGNATGGATVALGISFKGIGQPTRIYDCQVNDCSGIGIKLEGIAFNAGNLLCANTDVSNCPLGAWVVTGQSANYTFRDCAAHFVNAGVALIYIDGSTVAFYPANINISGLHLEGLLAGSIGVLIESARDVHVRDVMYFGSGSVGDLVRITGTTAEVQNVILENLTAAAASVANAIVDTTNNYTLANGANGVNVMRYDSGTTVHRGTIVLRRASDQASATTLTPNDGNILHLTGGTTIDNIVTSAAETGRILVIWFATATLVRCNASSGGNIFINGNFQSAAEDTITLVSNGVNWLEMTRTAVNYGKGTDIASAATIAIPVDGTVFHVTGSNNITNGITVNSWDNGRSVSLIFDGAVTVSDTGTSRLNGDFVANGDDTLNLVCDGNNWFETSRSVN